MKISCRTCKGDGETERGELCPACGGYGGEQVAEVIAEYRRKLERLAGVSDPSGQCRFGSAFYAITTADDKLIAIADGENQGEFDAGKCRADEGADGHFFFGCESLQAAVRRAGDAMLDADNVEAARQNRIGAQLMGQVGRAVADHLAMGDGN